MTRYLHLLVGLSILGWMLVACGAPTSAPPAPPNPVAPTAVQATAPVVPTAPPTPPAIATGQIFPTPTKAAPVSSALTCPPATPVPANVQLAARVNGQGIPLELFNRLAAQAQAAMIQSGLDPKSAVGQESLKNLKLQVLEQLINDVVIAQQAEYQAVRVTDDDVNKRLAEMLQDAGGVEKLNEYLTKNQMTLSDFCAQLRSNLVSEIMFNRITSAFPTVAEQVHVRQILVSTPATAQTLRDRARRGEDFAALAKQYSLDETSKTNGGDLGWVPRGVLDPRLDAVIFDLPVGQVSDVITTNFGYHIVQVIAKDKARPLPPELLQDQRQRAFLEWLKVVRDSVKIERFVQP
ncbi:MAG: peptidylprolyl isomerase [Anaerolineae bacterium]|nr:peptidylprolyl isomerase [Anaerolineae bacterium]